MEVYSTLFIMKVATELLAYQHKQGTLTALSSRLDTHSLSYSRAHLGPGSENVSVCVGSSLEETRASTAKSPPLLNLHQPLRVSKDT